LIGLWTKGLIRGRFGRTVGAMICVGCVVGLLLDLGLFIDQSSRTLTTRALASNTTDFQIELNTRTDPNAVASLVGQATRTQSVTTVGYADIDAFEFRAEGTVQTTGAGKVVGLPANYFARRSNDIRVLSGDLTGAVLLQQTAANLHAAVGDVVTLRRPALPEATVPITGIVDLKSADAFFQAVGLPPGAAPTAPPDNAVLMPLPAWHELFDPQLAQRPDTVHTELHVVIDRTGLPTDPADAYVFATGLGHNIEARLAGRAMLANNLAAQLDAARGDALYAKVLFLFLGAPGGLLGALLTLIISRSAESTRARDHQLLRRHGATPAGRIALLAAEAAVIGAGGSLLGLLLGVGAGAGLAGLGLGWNDWPWIVGTTLAGFVLALASLGSTEATSLLRGDRLASRSETTTGFRAGIPLWQKLYLDVACLGLAGIVFWQTAASGYQIVLATEGVAAVSVDYTAFLAPLLLWVGGGLAVIRLTRFGVRAGRTRLARVLSGLAGTVGAPIAAALSWQRRRIALAVALVTLAVGFLVSTAIFNATYEAQARVDAELTNGADVTITGTSSTPAGSFIAPLRTLPGVVAAEPMQHRFAYVGTDLQDLYGIDPSRITAATDLSNAYFAGEDAAKVMADLVKWPDGVLVSEETVSDFQLQPGDTLNLRLMAADRSYHVVPFVFIGVAREFPTAPHDSFLVANAKYVAQQTGLDAEEVVLLRASADPDIVKRAAESLLNDKGLQVTSLPDAVRTLGTNLTAVDLRGLSRIELAFAIILGIVATGLNLALGFADRRRDFVILRALGATRTQLARFVWGEALIVSLAGLLFGAILGTGVAEILVVVLQGVFDPPPEWLTVPAGLLLLVGLVFCGASALAVLDATARADRGDLSYMREGR